MGKLLDDTNAVLEQIDQEITETLSLANEAVRKYEDGYILSGTEFKDPDVLKERMKEKIELGIREYDS